MFLLKHEKFNLQNQISHFQYNFEDSNKTLIFPKKRKVTQPTETLIPIPLKLFNKKIRHCNKFQAHHHEDVFSNIWVKFFFAVADTYVVLLFSCEEAREQPETVKILFSPKVRVVQNFEKI